MHTMRLFRLAMFFCAVLAQPNAADGQLADANLMGSLVDSSNGVLEKVLVELINEATGSRLSTTTDDSGSYRFLNVLPGLYTLKVDARGFAPVSMTGLTLQLNHTHTANLRLDVSGTATAMMVIESSALIDTSTAALQTTFSSRIATTLPLTGSASSILNLSLLSAGVSSSGGLGYGTGPSIGGQRPSNNNFMIEGVDNNSRAATGPVLIVPNEAITELTLQQNQFSPEFGHSSGGQFNVVVKSGTNAFHGSLYHYLKNRHLNAVDAAYARQGITELPRFDQNRFGGTISGPVKSNRIFFFTALEGQLRGHAATSAGAVYSPTAEGLGTLASLPGINKKNLDVFARYVPVASTRNRDIIIQGRMIPVGIPDTVGPSYSNDLRTVSSTDMHLSNRDQLRGRWIMHRGESVEGSTALPIFYTPVRLANHVVSLAEFHTFSPSLLSEFRFGYNRSNEDRSSGSMQFPGLDAFPSLQFNDLSLGIGPHVSYPQTNRSNVYQGSVTFSWIHRSHWIKAGYDLRKLNSSFNFIQRQRGEYVYNTLERYLLDITPEWGMRSVGVMPFVGNQVSHYTFLNDEWRIRPNVTLSLGLRYEFVGVPEGARQQALNSIASVPGVLEFQSPKASGLDFAPRIGLAWSPGTTGRSVVRAGFGMAYDQNYHNLAINSLPPQYSTSIEAHIERPDQTAFLASGGITGTAVPVTSSAVARSLTGYWIPDQQRPYAINWTVGIQRVLAKDYNLELRYLGTKGVHLPMQTQMNRPAAASVSSGLPLFLTRPSDAELNALTTSLDMFRPVNTLASYGFARTITTYAPRGNSSYHGLATQLSRRYSNGLQFLVAHTWSHNIDDSTAVVASTVLTPRRPQDFFDLRSERANSMLDHRHRLTTGWVYDFNFGGRCLARWCAALVRNWTVAGTFTAESGTWATVRSGVDSNVNSDPLSDRTIINPAGDARLSSTVTPLLNTGGKIVGYLAANPVARYIQAGPGSYPNAGRNTLLLPGINNLDLSVGKRFRFDDHRQLHLRLEAYNALNHAQFSPGFTNSVDVRPRVTSGANSLLLTGNALFNRPDLAFESNSRQLQLVLRFEF